MIWTIKKELDMRIKVLEQLQELHNEEIKKTISKIDIILATKPDYLSIEEKTRLADLEIKMTKLWSILLEQTPTGKDKLSKVGRTFQERFGRN